MPPKQSQQLSRKDIEQLLNEQTVVILEAVDGKVSKLEVRLDKLEMRVNKKIERLTTTLDKFLKRMTDLEEEFIIMKADVRRVKTVLREKLGVTID